MAAATTAAVSSAARRTLWTISIRPYQCEEASLAVLTLQIPTGDVLSNRCGDVGCVTLGVSLGKARLLASECVSSDEEEEDARNTNAMPE